MLNSFALKFFNSRRKRMTKRLNEHRAIVAKKKQLALRLAAPLSLMSFSYAR